MPLCAAREGMLFHQKINAHLLNLSKMYETETYHGKYFLLSLKLVAFLRDESRPGANVIKLLR